jgi:integrase
MSGPGGIGRDVASVAAAWMGIRYDEMQRGGPDRARRVRRIIEGHLVPWFAPRTVTVADVSYYLVHDWLLHLVGREPTPRDGRQGRPAVYAAVVRDGDEVGLADAARMCGVSVVTMRRRWQSRRLPGAHRDHRGHVRVPGEALRAFGVADRPVGLSQEYASDALWVLRQVLAFARANGLFPAGFDPTEGLMAPRSDPAMARTPSPSGRPRPLTPGECSRIASHLHAVHQTVFWLQRIMGLRISEAYGLRVRDVIAVDHTVLLAVHGQGGRTFPVRGDDGTLIGVPHKDTVKTAAGARVLVAPTRLVELLEVVIDAFHTDPTSGTVDRASRLVPGLRRVGEAGQFSYHRALAEAANVECLGSGDLGFRVSSHLLRKSVATDLAWQSGIEDSVRRRFMGHRAGDDVFGRVYTLEDPELAGMMQVAAFLDDHIGETITTLLTPTTRTISWGKTHPLAARAGQVETRLAAAGWLVRVGDTQVPLCDAERVAVELGVSARTAGLWMVDGTLPTVTIGDSAGVGQRRCRLSDVVARGDRLAGRVALVEMAEQLGVDEAAVYRRAVRLGLDLEQNPASGKSVLSAEAMDALRAESDRIAALRRRSMKLAAASVRLHLSASSVRLLAEDGTLELDPETDDSGARYVTCRSTEAYWFAQRKAVRRRGQRVPAVPIADVASFTGQSQAS